MHPCPIPLNRLLPTSWNPNRYVNEGKVPCHCRRPTPGGILSTLLFYISPQGGKTHAFRPNPQRPNFPERSNEEYKDEDTKGFHQGFSIDTDSVATTEDSEEHMNNCRHDEAALSVRGKLSASSRSIPIPFKTCGIRSNGAIPDYENEVSIKRAELHYELATWNMYDRIMEYREKHSFGLGYQHDSENTQLSQTTSTTREAFENSQNPAVEYYEMDDGIFDMEV